MAKHTGTLPHNPLIPSPLFPLLLFFFLTGCQQDAPLNNNIPQEPYYTNTQDFFNQNYVEDQSFTLTAETGGTITGKKGTKINFPANAFQDYLGNQTSGQINITIKEIFKKNDMILSNKPSMSDGQPIITAGEIYVKVVAGDVELRLAPATYFYMILPADSLVTTMKVFYGSGDSLNNINWHTDTLLHTGTVSVKNLPYPSYELTSFNLSWISCARYYVQPQTADVSITLANDTTFTGAQVYLVLKDNSVMQLKTVSGFSFSATGVPVGPLNLVGLTIHNHLLYFAASHFTLQTGYTGSITLTPTTTVAFKSYLYQVN